MIDPLFHEGWIAFNERQWGVRAERVELGPKSGTAWSLQAVLYRSKHGGLVTPPRNAYLPVLIDTGEARASTMQSRRREAIAAFADRVATLGVSRSLTLSPVVDDARPFQWFGFEAAPRYTYYIDLPLQRGRLHTSVLKKIRKAMHAGYVCEVASDLREVHDCLRAPEERKEFDHKVDAKELGHLFKSMGPDSFVALICRSAEGTAIGAKIQFCSAGGMVHAWSAGVKTDGLNRGVNQLLNSFALQISSERNCTVFDYCGANIPSVAVAKEAWGGRLVPYYTIRPKSFRNVLFTGYQWLKAFKRPPDR